MDVAPVHAALKVNEGFPTPELRLNLLASNDLAGLTREQDQKLKGLWTGS